MEASCRVFDRKPLRDRIRLNVHRIDMNRQPEPLRELATEALVTRRGRSELMIHMCQRDDAEAPVFRQLAKHDSQCDGIRSAGYRDEHTAPGRAQCVPTDRAADLLLNGAQCSMPNAQCPMLKMPNDRLSIGHWALGFGL